MNNPNKQPVIRDIMSRNKKSQKKTFGRSFENAYLSTSSQKFLDELLHLELPKKPEKGIPKIAGVADPIVRKKMQEQLAQSIKLARIGTMTCGITNEINNPLAGIMGYAEIMKDEKNPQLIKKYAEKIVREANKASEIISWITRYGHGAKDSDISSIDVHDVINESLDALRHMRTLGDIHIIKDFRKIPQIKGNRTELQQVFVNLIDNAADSMNNRGILDITTHMNNGSLEVIISDSGEGIPSENLNRIFEPFFTTKEGEKGTGLGLVIVKGLIEAHNGAVQVFSREGEGSCFLFTLPVKEIELSKSEN